MDVGVKVGASAANLTITGDWLLSTIGPLRTAR